MESQESNNTQESVDTQSDTEVTEGTEQGSASTESPESAATEKSELAEGGSDDSKIEFTKDFEGKEFVPRDAFEKRLAAITAKNKTLEEKHKEQSEFLEAVRNNPDVRKKFMEELSKAEKPATEASSSPLPENVDPTEFMKPINSWLAKLSATPEHQSFYTDFTKSILDTVQGSVVYYVQKTINDSISREVAPLKETFGKKAEEEFAKAHPDYTPNKAKIDAIQKKLNIPREEAYKNFKYDVLMQQLAQRETKNSPAKNLGKVPIQGRQSTPRGEVPEPAMTRSEAIRAAIRQHSNQK